jgi:ABC-type nitrate/sulfonate/bicarbonate transport system substrate-binding protein
VPASNIIEVMKRDKVLEEELAKLGYTVNFYSFLKGSDMNYFLYTGDLEVCIGGDMDALMAASINDLLVTSTVQEGPVYIVSRDVREVSGLRGKRIAYAYGSNAHFYLLNTLLKNDVDLDSVDLVNMDVVDMPEALSQREVDAFVASGVTPNYALSKYDFVVTHRGRSYGYMYLKDDLYEDDPEVAHQLVASQIRALNWLRASEKNLNMANEWVLSTGFGQEPLSVETLNDIVMEDGMNFRYFPRVSESQLDVFLKNEFDLLVKLGFISKNVVWDVVKQRFDSGIIDAVVSSYDYRNLEAIDEA